MRLLDLAVPGDDNSTMLDLTPPALRGLCRIGMTLKSDAFTVDRPAYTTLASQAQRLFPECWTALRIGEQVHGTHVESVEDSDARAFHRYPATDGLTTSVRHLALGILTADCTAIALIDPQRPILALVHAGWRGTYDRILSHTLESMKTRYGSDPSKCFAVLGPSIGGSCYEISRDLADRFRDAFPQVEPHLSCPPSGKPFLDLRGFQRSQLLDGGISPEHIGLSQDCTHCDGTRFHSYRREGASTGRHLTIGVLL